MVAGDHQGMAGAELRLLERDRRRLRPALDLGGDVRHVGGQHHHRTLAPAEPAARPSTCSIMERPASRCSTFGRGDFIRVPLPAARITTVTGELMISAPYEASLRNLQPQA